jgi:hypothetical protein
LLPKNLIFVALKFGDVIPKFVEINKIKIFRGVAQLASAPRSGRGGRKFESSHPDELQNQKNSKACKSNDLQAFLFQIPW